MEEAIVEELSQTDDGGVEEGREGERTRWSLTDIEAAIAVNYPKVSYAKLRRFAEVPGLAEFLGAEKAEKAKGLRYPATAVAMFEELVKQHEQGMVTPGTAKAWIENLRRKQPDSTISPKSQSVNSRTDANENGAIVPLLQLDGEAQLTLAKAVGEAMAQALVSARVVPTVAEDKLVGKDEAATVLHCPPAAVSRYVRPVRRGVWRWSDIQTYIAQLRPQEAQKRRMKGSAEQA